MNEVRENPLGVDGFEFVEYAAPQPEMLHQLFRSLGFTPIARHKQQAVTLYRQGDINFLVNEQPDSFAARFAAEHGPCCTGFALRVEDARDAYASTLANGAASMTEIKPVALDAPRIKETIEKLEEEIGEFKEAVKSGNPKKVEDEMGDLLFALVNVSRFVEVHPEEALKKTIHKFIRRFNHVEVKAERAGKSLDEMTLEEMDAIWDEAKHLEDARNIKRTEEDE